jgi:hypothetical protein
MMELDIHIIQGERSDHVMTIHRTEKDETPLQMVSAAQIKEWMRMEVDYDALMARLEEPEEAPIDKACLP